jgi:hypothetical protein
MTLRELTDRHGDRITGVGYLGATHQTVRRLHGNGTHHVVADVLGHLQGEHAVTATFVALIEGHVDGQCVIQARHRLSWELHVNDWAGDAGNTADAGLGLGASGHGVPSPYALRASAPPTISLISWVISACRA